MVTKTCRQDRFTKAVGASERNGGVSCLEKDRCQPSAPFKRRARVNALCAADLHVGS